MKKIILSIVIALSGIITANAQLYIGGSLNVNVGSQSFGFSHVKTDTNNPITTTNVNNFDLGFSTENVLPSIGIIYKF